MGQVEMYVVVAIGNIATEARVGQVIVGDDYRGALFNEVDVDVAAIDAPVDVVGHVVPGGSAVVVNPVARTFAEAEWIDAESNLTVSSVVVASVVVGGNVHVATPSSLEAVSYKFVLACGECDAHQGRQHHGEYFLHSRKLLSGETSCLLFLLQRYDYSARRARVNP